MTNLGPPAPPTRVGEPVGFSRTTRDGRRLHYELKVLQQPERARACGSGPKSSADRRPVDPPPVVQMKVFQGMHRETAEDITFAYNADFFLYASLHHDPDPHHRPNLANAAVLTGLPVSSMILLDRPEEAGYFIFSDLSVRHEGRYILTFALMEEVKDDRDKDEDEAMAGTDEITGPDAGSGRHFQFRTQVQTDAFDVFSAKKFPGLQESTALSRTVAEQGCRVRIRRDVRMRRREKGGKGKEIAARHDDYAPRVKADAANIASRDGAHDGGMRSYRSNDLQRRPSGMETGYQHRPSYPSSVPSPGSRQPSYGHMASYPPSGRSVPPPPAYPTPPHGAVYPPRPLYAPYPHAERSPPEQHGPPAPPHPRDPRESYSYRGLEPIRPQPILAPKIEPEPELKRATLPSIHSIGVQEPRRLLPHPPAKREAERLTLPPLAPSAYNFQQRPAQPPTPITTSLSRKRSADEANLTPADEHRLQHGRRRDEQPHTNYKMEPARHSHSYQIPMPVVQEERPGPPVDWSMSLDLYNRASDSDIPVDFPGLHQSRLGTSA